MRIIKLGIISAVVLFLLITAMSLLIPSHVRISRATDINQPADSVLTQINDATNWKNWMPGADTSELYITGGRPNGVSAGKGQALVIKEKTDSTVTASYLGMGAGKGSMGWNLLPSGVPNTVTVQWYMDFHLRWYPWEKFSGLMFEKRYGPRMEQGLSRLKTMLEKY